MLGFLVIGFVLGIRHSLDADHLAAVGSLTAGGLGLRRAWVIGAAWGAGHTTSLLVAALAVVLIGLRIPERFSALAEAAVGVMLVILALRVFWRLGMGGRRHAHVHAHGPSEHLHSHSHPVPAGAEPHRAATAHGHPHGVRSYAVGVVHGLAGSAAVMLLAVANAPSASVGVIYVLAFGIGSIGGMTLMSTLLSMPLAISAGRWPGVNRFLQWTTGFVSLGLGVAIVLQAGVVRT